MVRKSSAAGVVSGNTSLVLIPLLLSSLGGSVAFPLGLDIAHVVGRSDSKRSLLDSDGLVGVLLPLVLTSLVGGLGNPVVPLHKSRGVGESGVGLVGVVVEGLGVAFSPCLPLLLSSYITGPSLSGMSLVGGEGVDISVEHSESGGIGKSGVGLIGVVVEGFGVAFSPGLPLLLTSDGASPSLSGMSLVSSECIDIVSELDCGGIRNSGVCLVSLVIKSIDVSLSPVLPLLLSFSSSRKVSSKGINVISELNGGGIGDSGVSLISLVVFPVNMVLSPSLPFLLTSKRPSRVLSRKLKSRGIGDS